jgi:acyl carrier protein phosphodiesterase
VNYLGHFYLAYPDEDLLVGNLLGDCVKGCGYEYYPERVSAGIRMHRAIDTFTDQNDISAQCRTLLRPVAGKFAGVALDILYDHVLANNWSSFTTKPLFDFTQDVYQILNARYEELTMENRILLGHMERENWLLRYATKEGTHKSLSGMSRRIAYQSNLDKVMPLYEKVEEEFDALALQFLANVIKELKVNTELQ